MKISSYLRPDVVETLMMFGNIHDVTNRILQEGENGSFSLEDIPASEVSKNKVRVNINVTNEYYLSLLETYGIRSPRISISRILTWFVDNEIYNELEWNIVNDFISKKDKTIKNSIDKLLNEMNKLKFKLNDQEKALVVHAMELISRIRRD